MAWISEPSSQINEGRLVVNWELMSSLVALNEQISINSHEPQIQGYINGMCPCVHVCPQVCPSWVLLM